MDAVLNERQIYNKEILKLLVILVEKFPDLRFNQLLEAFEFTAKEDKFYEESKDTFMRVVNKISGIKQEPVVN